MAPTLCGEPRIMCGLVESLCGTPETNGTFYQLYFN